LVDQHDIGTELPDVGVLGVVGVSPKRSSAITSAERVERKPARADASWNLLEQVGRQGPFQAHADGCATRIAAKEARNAGGRTHGVITLSWSRRRGMGY